MTNVEGHVVTCGIETKISLNPLYSVSEGLSLLLTLAISSLDKDRGRFCVYAFLSMSRSRWFSADA